MNILHIIDFAELCGGAEVVLYYSADSLPGKNFVYQCKKDPSFDESAFPNITFLYAKRKFSFSNLLYNVLEVKKIIKDNNIDIVHAQLFWSILTARLATPKSKKLFTTIQNIQSLSTLRTKKMQLIEKLSYRKDETTFCVSNAVNKDYKTIIPKANTITLYNFIKDEYFNNISATIKETNFSNVKQNSRTTYKLIAVGTVKYQKNYDYLIDIFAVLKEKGYTNISVDIYGDEGDGTLINGHINRAKGLNVNFKGVNYEIHRFINNYDGYIMTSLYEGFSLSILEALASKLPAFLPDLPIMRENTNNNAVFFDPSNANSAAMDIIKFVKTSKNNDDLVYNGYEWANKVARKSSYLKSLVNYYSL